MHCNFAYVKTNNIYFMKDITNYQEHIDQAIKWIWEILPNLVTAIILFIVGLWVIRLINRFVINLFKRKDIKG